MNSSVDVKIWKFFDFYNEKLWIPLSVLIAAFVMAGIVIYLKESARAKEEERAKKLSRVIRIFIR